MVAKLASHELNSNFSFSYCPISITIRQGVPESEYMCVTLLSRKYYTCFCNILDMQLGLFPVVLYSVILILSCLNNVIWVTSIIVAHVIN